MPVTAQFTADFTQFNAEVKQAEKQLDLFETEADQAGEAVERLGTTTQTAAPKTGAMATNFKNFDGILAAVGINIRPLIASLGEMGITATATVGSLGALTIAGGTLAAAITGWGIGRKIAESFGTDKWIGDQVAAWMGWGDVMKETGLAMEDSLAKASDIAGYRVNNLKDAIVILTGEQKKNQETAKQNAEAYKVWREATDDVIIAGQNHAYVLRHMNQQQLEGAKYALEHGAAQKSVMESFKLSKSEMAAINHLLAEEVEARKKATEAAKKQAEELAKYNAQVAAAIEENANRVGSIIDDVFGVEALRKATAWVQAIETMGGSVEQLWKDDLQNLQKAMMAGINALARSGQLTSAQTTEFVRLAQASNVALQALNPLVVKTDELIQAQWEYVTAMDEANKKAAEVPPAMGPAKDSIDAIGYAAGNAADNFFSMSAELYNAIRAAQQSDAMEARVPSWGIVHPKPGGGLFHKVQPGVTVNVNSPLGTPNQIAKAVGNAVTGSYASGGNRMPV